MGLVRCDRHGDQTGPLTCDHVASAVRFESDLAETLVDFNIDMTDDGTGLLAVLACAPCARRVPASQGALIPSNRSEEPDFPYVVPACERCLTEWMARSSRSPKP
jgi:hypothetical protein